MEQTTQKREMVLNGLSCPNCAAAIEDKINKLPWVENARINLATQILTLNTEKGEGKENVREELQLIIDRIEDGVVLQDREERFQEQESTVVRFSSLIRKIPQIAGAILFVILVFFKSSIPAGPWTGILLFALSYLLIGHTVLLAALKNIRHGRVLDENFLMVIATIGAFAIKEYPEAVAVMLFYQIGEYFQDMAVDGSRRSIRKLLDSRPGLVRVLHNGIVRETAPEKVEPGAEILVRPGDRIPLDGVVLKGKASVDTSALTGESYPRQVQEGTEVLSGFVCLDSPLEIEVSRTLDESAYSRIIRMVEESSGRKARSEQFITRFARIYTPAVVGAAALLAFLPPLILEGAAFTPWIYRALVFLVVSCPCALVISVPLSFFAGIGKASRQGILVKGGNYLEALNRINTVVLDKTGTLTKGVFRVSALHPEAVSSKEELLHLAASAEAHSIHPIAQSIRQAWSEQSSVMTLPEADSVREVAGRGIQAEIEGDFIALGKKSWLEESCGPLPDSGAGTGVYLSRNGEFLGYLVLSDEIRDDASAAIENLRKGGIDRIVMLTGDSEDTARQVARSLNLDEYRANLLPEDKVRALEVLIGEGCRTVFAGDGINDAPVLARSDVGIAMGGLGSDAAIEAADIVLMSDEPRKIVTARRIARKTRRIVIQNIVLALGIKGLVLSLAAFGVAGMGLAVFADVGVALLAVLNAMRILLFRD